MFLSLFLLFSMLLLCSFLRLKDLFQVKNGLTTSLLFFLENAKNLGRSDDAKRAKKEDGLASFWLRTLTQVNFNHVNKIDAKYKVLRLNVK